MTEEFETAKEIAKAVQQTGKVAQGVAELVGNVGSWMIRVMGAVPEDIVALVAGDRLRALRLQKQLEHLDRIRRKQEEILNRRGVEVPETIGLKHAIPAFEAMADESDETLQDLWAHLLANAMDPSRDVRLQRIMIDTLKEFEPFDAVVFEKLTTVGNSQRSAAKLPQAMSGSPRVSLVQLSLDRLERLGCVVGSGHAEYHHSALGQELWRALK